MTTILGQDGWRELLAVSGLLVVALPLTRETRGVVGARELSKLPKGAIVLNVARGGLVDEDALIEALGKGALGGAGLDAFATEPLPAQSPLWHEPRALVSPRLGQPPIEGAQKWEGLFEQNLARFAKGEALQNLVARNLGY